jgi:tetratricopeptide (TPR) repeat protein
VSLVRRPFGWDALATIFPQRLREEEAALLKQCLMQKFPSNQYDLAVHPWQHSRPLSESSAHQKCFEVYNHFLGRTTETNQWRFSLEAAHHASLAGNWTVFRNLTPLFGDLYSLYGKRASLAAQESGSEEMFKLAIHFFEKAIEVDGMDDYAHHYLAYNLDYAALDIKRSGHHYRQAIEIAPSQPWWHSRYISFLVTIGLTADAYAAWVRAQDDLRNGNTGTERRIVEEFHRWVLRLLLHRSHLDFAAEVLRDIPETLRDEVKGVRLMEAMLTSMVEAAEGRDVYPIDVPLSARWVSPRLLTKAEEERPLKSWFAGKIEYVSGDEVGLLLGSRDAGTGEIRYYRSKIPWDSFGEMSDTKISAVEEGDYLELCVFSADDEVSEDIAVVHLVRTHRRLAIDDLPALKPDPRRYLRRQGWIGGKNE